MPKPPYPQPGDEIVSDWAKGLIDWVEEGHPVPGCSAHSSALTAGVAVTCKLDVRDAGSATFLDAPGNRFIVPAAMGGLYRITGAFTAANTATGERHIASILRNGVSIGASYAYPNVGGTIAFAVALDVLLVVGDAITFTGGSTVTADWTVAALIARAGSGLAP